MKVFFDNCTSPRFATTLHGFISHDGHEAHHLRDLFPPNAKDEDWITELGKDSADWIIITGDRRFRSIRAAREAWKEYGLIGFVLAPAYQKTPVYQCASHIVWWWPRIEKQAELAAKGSLFEIQIRRSGRFTSLPV